MKTSFAHLFTLYQFKIQVNLKVNQLCVYHNVLIFRPKENNLSLIHGELPTWRTGKQSCILGPHQSCLFLVLNLGSFLRINRILWLFVASAI